MKNSIGKVEQNKYQIKTIRADWWDYSSSGVYFVTICLKKMHPVFGKLVLETVSLNSIGLIANTNWLRIPEFFPFISLGPYIIMPDHLHGIIFANKLTNTFVNQKKMGPQSNNLASIIRGFKSSVTIEARKIEPNFAWQKLYFDRIIRNEEELENVIQYIYDNPIKG